MHTSPIESISRFHDELIQIRRDLHAHPELGFEEHRTADVVARELERLGIEVHRDIGRTGVVGVLHGQSRTSGRCIGLRADIDALPIQEENTVEYASRFPGKMHGCGHDGHIAMLLGAARYLAETRRYDGTVCFIFQPGEEGHAGARAMIADGLFERFPIQSVFALHNWPSMPAGTVGLNRGPMMAAIDRFEIIVHGQGGHGAHPHQAIDPILVGAQIVTALQSIVSRNVNPVETAVVSLQSFQAGRPEALSVIPAQARMAGMVKWFRPETQTVIRRRLEELVLRTAEAFGARAELSYAPLYPPTINDATEAELVMRVAERLLGPARVQRDIDPSMGSEDFAFMLQARPGAYFRLGQGPMGGCFLHNPRYDFNDETISVGSGMFAAIVEEAMPL